jgi:hypothetical protein
MAPGSVPHAAARTGAFRPGVVDGTNTRRLRMFVAIVIASGARPSTELACVIIRAEPDVFPGRACNFTCVGQRTYS